MSTTTGSGPEQRQSTAATTSGDDSDTTEVPAEEGDSGNALQAAKAPVGSGLTPVFAQFVALLLLAVGVVAVQEAVARTGIVSTSWTSWLLTRLDGKGATFGTLVLFVVLVLIGLVLLLVVFRPRPAKTLTLRAHTGVYLRTQDLARLAQARVDGAGGVTNADAVATRTRLTVRVGTVGPADSNQTLQDDVQARLRPTLEALQSAPRLSVAVTNQELT